MVNKITLRQSGPLFDGRAAAATDAYMAEAQRAVAGQGLANVHHLLDASIKHPTPYYETQLTIQRVAATLVVHDRKIIYGPWLEGVGERNKTSRFKGYHHWRLSTQLLRRQAPILRERVLRDYLPRMR